MENIITCDYSARLLYRVPELADECCILLNHEWKRSHEARMRSLNFKNDNYPLNMVLIGKENEKRNVVGHCRISAVRAPDNHGPAVFLESVVISPHLRGKGLGRLLISQVEAYLKTRGVRSLYLYTMGQEKFYGKLGYTPCQPVDVFSSVPDLTCPSYDQLLKPTQNKQPSMIREQNGPAPPPPPPPPLQATPRICASERSFYKGSKTFMHKIIFPTGEYRP